MRCNEVSSGLFWGVAGHNKKNVRTDGRDGSIHTCTHTLTYIYTYRDIYIHTWCQSAEECFAVLELIDALISWPFIPTFRLSRRRSGPPRSSELRRTILPRPAPAIFACSIEYFLSAKSRKMTLRYFERFVNLTPRLSPSVWVAICNKYPTIILTRSVSVFHPIRTTSKGICRRYLQKYT